MENIPDAVIVLPKSDLKKIDKVIAKVAGEINVRPTKIVFEGDEVQICYRPWHMEVFKEVLNETS